MKWIAILMLTFASIANADTETVMPELIEQMGYKVSRPMPCNWPGADQTTIFGYYGHKQPNQPADPALSLTQGPQVDKTDLFQIDLEREKTPNLPKKEAFGLNLNLEFAPEHMVHEGMRLQLVEIDYNPTNKRCTSGFGGGLITR